MLHMLHMLHMLQCSEVKCTVKCTVKCGAVHRLVTARGLPGAS